MKPSPQRTLHRQPFGLPSCSPGVSQASATPYLHALSCHTMLCIATAVSDLGDPDQRRQRWPEKRHGTNIPRFGTRTRTGEKE